MSPNELEESIILLRRNLFDIASIKGFSNERSIEICKRIDLYLKRYSELNRKYRDGSDVSV
jgi:hypothetical protein